MIKMTRLYTFKQQLVENTKYKTHLSKSAAAPPSNLRRQFNSVSPEVTVSASVFTPFSAYSRRAFTNCPSVLKVGGGIVRMGCGMKERRNWDYLERNGEFHRVLID